MENTQCSGVKNLTKYISDSKEILTKFEAAVGWAAPDLNNGENEIISCPHDSNHLIPRCHIASHTRSCKWKKLGYSSAEVKDILQEEDAARGNRSFSINTDAVIEMVAPGTPQIRSDNQYRCLLSPEQRLAIYQEEVQQCYTCDKPIPDKALYADLEAQAAEKLYKNENPEKLSEVELLQKLRDMKKRRQSYRAKNVHITKRSQTEIVRGVLEVHMEELRRLWNTKPDDGSKSSSVKEKLSHNKVRSDRDSSRCIEGEMPPSHVTFRHSPIRDRQSEHSKHHPSRSHSSTRSSHRKKDDRERSRRSRSPKEKSVSFDKNYAKGSILKDDRSSSGKTRSKHKDSHKSKRKRRSRSPL